MPPPKKDPKKKAAPKKSAASGPSGPGAAADQVDVEHEPRLMPPKLSFDGSDREKYRNFRRGVTVWRSKYTTTSDRRLGSSLMECIEDKAADKVYDNLAEGEETYANILKVLDSVYGQKELPATTKYLMEFRAMKRDKQNLADFLADYKTARTRAIRYGMTPSPETDGCDLLVACSLTVGQHSQILQNLQMAAKMSGETFAKPAWDPTLDQLELLAQTFMIHDEDRKVKKRPTLAAMPKRAPGKRPPPSGGDDDAPSHKRPRDGKGAGGKGSMGRKRGVCWDFQQGKCTRGGACKFAHDKAGGTGKGDGKGVGKGGVGKGGDKGGKGGAAATKSKNPCRDFAAGSCRRGEACWFSHST
ncbi:MAG TPA: zinc finger CCCH domain-containing protein [Planctomycetes bacterium]|nr:zinc finger CCCH domain-containing protein [Planctomycetota bacterium]